MCHPLANDSHSQGILKIGHKLIGKKEKERKRLKRQSKRGCRPSGDCRSMAMRRDELKRGCGWLEDYRSCEEG